MSPPSAVALPTVTADTVTSLPLPDAKSPTLRLLHPTDGERQATWKNNGQSWRGPLSMSAYLRREQHLRETSLTRNGGLTHWVLVDTSEPPAASGSERRIYASCETIRKRALVGYTDVDGQARVEEVVSHGIGSVFCAEKYRGRGYAGRMMRELGEILRTWQTDKSISGRESCLFTVLYSDIGKKFYALHGWHPFASTHIVLPPVSGTIADFPGIPRSRPVYAASLKGLCAIDECLLRQNLAKPGKIGKVHVALVPGVESMEYHHAREEFIAGELLGRDPTVKGAIVGDVEGKRAWCVWCRVFDGKDGKLSGSTLHILRLVIEGEEDIDRTDLAEPSSVTEAAKNGIPEAQNAQVALVGSLLFAAQCEAAQWNLKDVQIWNPTPVTILAAQQILNHTSGGSAVTSVEVVDRETESITSLRWYGSGQPADLAGLDWGDVEWIGNEKYAWC